MYTPHSPQQQKTEKGFTFGAFGASIRTSQNIWCLPYAGFFLL
jgi:hypothetical protein